MVPLSISTFTACLPTPPRNPLEKHYVSSRSRSQKGILVFLARDAAQGVLRYANAGVTKSEQAGEILQFVRFWKKHTGELPAELVEWKAGIDRDEPPSPEIASAFFAQFKQIAAANRCSSDQCPAGSGVGMGRIFSP